MATVRCRSAFWTALVMLVGAGCGGRAGEQQSESTSAGGTNGAQCDPGVTRECVGPGACRGGQQCSRDGDWGICECAATGGAGQGPASGGAHSGGHYGFGGTGGAATLTGGAHAGGTGSETTGGSASVATGGDPSGGFTTGGNQAGGESSIGGNNDTGGLPATTGGAFTGGESSMGGSSGMSGQFPTGGRTATGGAPNQPPKILDLSFAPLPVRTDDALTVLPKAVDPESNPISFTYAWTCNGVPVGTNSPVLYGSAYFSKGDTLSVTVTPSDWQATGTPVTSKAIVVENSPPQFNAWATLSPGPYVDDETPLACQATASDPDGEPITYSYSWYLNDAPTTNVTSALSANATSMGDRWSCSVSATDGSSSADAGRSDATTIASVVSGILRSDTTWQAAKSPYVVTDRIQIAGGVTLKIEPGVTVMGEANSLESWGNVSAQGTKDKPIRLLSLYTYDNSASTAPGKITLAFVQFDGGSFLSSSASAQVTATDSIFHYLTDTISLPAGVATPHRFERNLFSSTCGIYANGPLVLTSNTFVSTDTYCSLVTMGDSLVANLNSFFPDMENMIVLGPKSADVRNNFWGGLIDTEIPGRIFDNNDDLNVPGVADYLPTLAEASADAPPTDKTYLP